MAFVKVFCFWFSVRLGSIIIGLVTLLQAIIWLVFLVIWVNNPKENSKVFNEFLDRLGVNDGILREVANEPIVYLSSLATFFAFLSFFCILMVIGSLQCKPKLLYPFIVLYPIYVTLLITVHIFLMLCFKNQEYGIGTLILYSNLGGFFDLYMLYLWVCVLSFAQIIHELRHELDERRLLPKVKQNKKIISARLGKSYYKY